MSKRMRCGSRMRRNMVNGNLNGGDLVNNLLKFGIGDQNTTTFTWDDGKLRRVTRGEKVKRMRDFFKI